MGTDMELEAVTEGKNRLGVNIFFRTMITTALILSASAIGYGFRALGFLETNTVIVYLLAVLLTTRFTKGYVFGVLASIAATFAFNFFFTEPYYSFSVYNPDYFVTFFVMTSSSLITSTLTSRVKQSALEAKKKEAETKALYSLTSQLTDAQEEEDIAGIAIKEISSYFKCKAACLCLGENEMPEDTFLQQHSPEKQIRRNTLRPEEIRRRLKDGRGEYSRGEEFWDWPIYGREGILGAIRIPSETAEAMDETKSRLLQPMIESMALAMDRSRSLKQRIKSREETIQERYRGNLLRAISHDLRTPLSGIIGTSEMIMGMTPKEDSRYALAEGIHKDADWLHSLVENILSLTRLQDGKLTIEKQMEAVEEIVGGALAHIFKSSPHYEIMVDIPDELLLVPMDAKLIQQVLINLLDNAIKHTPPENEICISVKEDRKEKNAVFSIRDRGSGIEDSQLAVIFQAFYTSRGKMPDAQRGIGLGLTICDAIVRAHGGSIEAHNRTDGAGAEFIFALPMPEA